MEVTKYRINETFQLGDNLFIEDNIIYITKGVKTMNYNCTNETETYNYKDIFSEEGNYLGECNIDSFANKIIHKITEIKDNK